MGITHCNGQFLGALGVGEYPRELAGTTSAGDSDCNRDHAMDHDNQSES